MIGILGSLVSLYYYIRVVVQMYMVEPEAQATGTSGVGGHLDFFVGLTVVMCAVLTLLFGIWPGNFLTLPKSAVEQVVGR